MNTYDPHDPNPELGLSKLDFPGLRPKLDMLRVYLDTLTITPENIGDVRRSLFRPGCYENSPELDCEWNSWVRDETARRENSPKGGRL